MIYSLENKALGGNFCSRVLSVLSKRPQLLKKKNKLIWKSLKAYSRFFLPASVSCLSLTLLFLAIPEKNIPLL